MARIATTGWVSGEVTKSRVRAYHLAFVLGCVLVASAIAAPSVLRQRTLYRAQAMVQWDQLALPGLVDQQLPTQALRDRQAQIGGVLKADYEGLGGRLRGVQWGAPSNGSLAVTAYTPDPIEAERLANVAADKLTRWLYTVVGDQVLREVLSHQDWAALNSLPTTAPVTPLLRRMLVTGAFGEVRPQAEARALDQLTDAERFALTRSLEVLYDLKGLDVRRAAATLQFDSEPQEQAKAQELQRGAQAAHRAVRDLTDYMYNTYGTGSALLVSSPAYVAAQATTAATIPTYKGLKLLIAALVGLLGGLLTVRLDRNVGIVPTLAGLWDYREMIRNIVSRDLKARYKSSLLGYLWSLLNPLMTMLIFWVVFSVLLRNDIPQFPVFLIVALLPWNYAVGSVSGGMRAILDNSNLVKKVYFPRAILPITVVLSNLVNYLLALPIMFIVMFGVQWFSAHQLQVSWTFVYLPLIIVIQTIFLIGVTLLLSTTAVFFRDTTHIVDIFLQLWIFITPVFFSLDVVTQGNANAARVVRWLNPMASIIDFYRDILYGGAILGRVTPTPPSLPALDGVFRTLLTSLIILALGAYVFQRNSRRFGEEL